MRSRAYVLFGASVFAVALAACFRPTLSNAQNAVLEPPEARPSSAGQRGSGVPEFWVRPGYRVDLVAEVDGEARFLEMDDKGTLYVSQPGARRIVAFRKNGEKYEPLATFVENYPRVHGMCFHKGWLWFSQSGSIHKARDTNGDGKADEIVDVIPQGQLPEGGGHWWRSLLVSDDAIYTSIGDASNASDQTSTERQKVWRFNVDGTGKKLWSSGIRNTEKLRFRPGTSEVWGMDHGSDWFGGPLGDKEGRQPITDYNPPEELNHYVEGGFYGHPFIVGNRVPRIEFQDRADIIDLAEKTIVPAYGFGAHWAGNGFTFLTSDSLGPDHKGDMLVAFHGSWNRQKRAGYRVERVLFDEVTGQPYGSLMIVSTLKDQDVLARPVDLVEEPGGSVLFSCDSTRRIYRISKATRG